MTRGGLNAEEQIQRTSDHHDLESGGSGTHRQRCLSGTRDQRSQLLSVEVKVWWHGSLRHSTVAGAGRRKPAFKGHVCRALFRTSDLERGARKKAVKPAVKRKLIVGIREQFGVSERLACRALALGRSVYRYQPQPNRDGEVIKLLLELAHGRPEQGFPKLFKRMRRLGCGWNHKRVYRIYCSLKLNKRRKGKRRLPNRSPAPLSVSEKMNECWSADFMSDALWCGHRFRY